MKRIIFLLGIQCCLQIPTKAQELFIDKGTLVVDNGGTLIVKDGDLQSNADLFVNNNGNVIVRSQVRQQKINFNQSGGPSAGPFSLSNLEIDNPMGAELTGHLEISRTLKFTAGNIFLKSFNLTFKNQSAAVGGYSNNKGVITDGTGYCEYELGSNLTEGFVFPIGYKDPNPTLGVTQTRPAPINLYNTGGTLSTGIPKLRAQVKYGKSPNSPLRTQSYTTAYWPIRVSGINNGDLTGTGYYGYVPNTSIPDFVGNENEIVGFAYNNADWILTGSDQDLAGNSVTATINTTVGEIFGMNKFVYLKGKALLQAAYSSAGVMNDNLRTPTNLIPLNDPYRTAPYNTSFTHVNNAVPEVAGASVFADQATTNDNIVDWVFVEVRNAVSSGSTILQTRSALLQKDGDIVDVDGKSPLYFKNLNDANYTITIRHRNHLAMSTNNAGSMYTRLSNLSYLSNMDFTTAASTRILGTVSNPNFNSNNYVKLGGFNAMYAGNANSVLGNNRVSYSGSANDPAYILGPVLNGAGNVLLNVYHQADVNMDRAVRFSGSSNDPSFILSQVLVGFSSGSRTEIKPQ